MNNGRLNWQAGIFGIAAITGFLIYLSVGSPHHFFNHFFIGISFGLLVLIVLSLRGMNTIQYEYSVPLIFWMFAIIPEFLADDKGHQGWTNIFLFHQQADHILNGYPLILVLYFLVSIGVLVIYLKVRRS